MDLRSLDGDIGFTVTGIDGNDYAGLSVGGAGDVNGDGFEDFLVGAPKADPNGSTSGEAYLVFGGSAIGSGGTLALSGLGTGTGFVLNGLEAGDQAGTSVNFAGDVNGDGIGDFIIGGRYAYGGPGEAYVVFGASDIGTGGTFELSALNGTNGFLLRNDGGSDQVGRSVGSSDVNGDGFDDLIIGAPRGDPPGGTDAGESYVVFGGSSVGAGVIQLSALNGTNGFILNGDDASDNSGLSVSGAGDVNGDGINDFIIGAPFADPSNVGESYVVFGQTNIGSSGTLELSALTGSNGFTFFGFTNSDQSGYSVSGAGDFNGDGVADVIIGASYADPNSVSNAGEVYVVFGGSTVGSGGSVSVTDLNGTNGIIIKGGVIGRHIGASVGTGGVLQLSALASGGGFEIPEKLEGDALGDNVRGAGDINGDGFDDLIAGAGYASPVGNKEGEAYIIFGGDFSQALTKQGTSGNDLLTGTGGADVFVGGLGNDTLLGNGGVDVLRGGAGDDILSVSNSAFRSLDGGTHTTATGGGDVLAFDSGGTTLDLTAIPDGKTESIEIIDIGGTGGNTLVLQLTDVLNLSEATNEIKIFGDADDFVSTSGETWSDGGNVVVDGETFKKFTLGGGTLLVDFVVDTSLVPT